MPALSWLQISLILYTVVKRIRSPGTSYFHKKGRSTITLSRRGGHRLKIVLVYQIISVVEPEPEA